MGKLFSATLLIGFLALQATVQTASAQPTTLTHNNSAMQWDPTSGAGVYNWFVNGQDQLEQQWFWIRVGATGPEIPLNLSGSVTTNIVSSRHMSATYANALFSIQVDYLLTGGTPLSGVSDLAETISINNLSGAPLDFHFFQYSDFNVGGIGADTVQLGTSLSGRYNEAVQTSTPAGISETVAAPGATRGEVGLYPGTLNKLTDGDADDLNNTTGPLVGDATWALQWDFILDPGSTYIISKDKHLIVPEPSTWALMSAGVILFALYTRRRFA